MIGGQEHVAVWSHFMRLGERMETGDSIFPRVGLERKLKEQSAHQRKVPEPQFKLNFLSLTQRERKTWIL